MKKIMLYISLLGAFPLSLKCGGANDLEHLLDKLINEITVLSNENLALKEENKRLTKECDRLKYIISKLEKGSNSLRALNDELLYLLREQKYNRQKRDECIESA